MWFRVELHKDGSVASCAQVASSFENGRTVRYVEADSPDAAIELVRRWRKSLDLQKLRVQKYKGEARQAGICVSCMHAQAVPGRVCCESCAARQRENTRTRKNGSREIARRNSPEESLRLYEERMARGLEKQKRRGANTYAYAQMVTRRDVLKEVLSRFDSCNAVVFRAWLDAELSAATTERPPKKRLEWRAQLSGAAE